MSEGHKWVEYERYAWTVCSRCGVVRNYDRGTPCKGSLPRIKPRQEDVPMVEQSYDVKAANRYRAYLSGWTHAARCGVMDERFKSHRELGLDYCAGYDAGSAARNMAAEESRQRSGYAPSPLRSEAREEDDRI